MSRRAQGRAPPPAFVWLLPVAMPLVCACQAPGGRPPAPWDAGTVQVPPNDEARAERLLVPASGAAADPLPSRAEVVALSDRLSIASSKAGPTPKGSRLAYVAGELRERLWRIDRVASDGREAAELYAAAADAVPRPEHACWADLRRGRLLGEMSRSAAVGYRELYLAQERGRTSVAGPGRPESCAAELGGALSVLEAFRPRGEPWAELVREGREAAEALQRRLGAALPASSAPASPGSGAPALSALADIPAPAGRDVVVSPDPSMLGPSPVRLTRIQHYGTDLGGRVVLSLEGPATYTAGTLGPNPDAGRGHRAYLDIAKTRLGPVAKEIEAGGIIERLRVGSRDEGVRVVLDLAAPAFCRVFYLPQPFRIVLDVTTRMSEGSLGPPPPAGRTLRRVALDPGHGGADAGAVGPTGLREKDVVLDIAHRAAPALAHELGVETLLTRDTDLYVPLEERAARANAYHADLFLSLHCNATDDGVADGVQVFVLDPTREADAVAGRVAARENALPHLRLSDQESIDRQIATIATGLDVGRLTGGSRRLAGLLERAALASLGTAYPATRSQGIRTAGFFVLVGAEMPAALFETAFISNPGDEARLATAEFRQRLADAVVNAVRAYRQGL